MNKNDCCCDCEEKYDNIDRLIDNPDIQQKIKDDLEKKGW